jgi:hypothetical protein
VHVGPSGLRDYARGSAASAARYTKVSGDRCTVSNPSLSASLHAYRERPRVHVGPSGLRDYARGSAASAAPGPAPAGARWIVSNPSLSASLHAYRERPRVRLTTRRAGAGLGHCSRRWRGFRRASDAGRRPPPRRARRPSASSRAGRRGITQQSWTGPASGRARASTAPSPTLGGGRTRAGRKRDQLPESSKPPDAAEHGTVRGSKIRGAPGWRSHAPWNDRHAIQREDMTRSCPSICAPHAQCEPHDPVMPVHLRASRAVRTT